jgi:hypothetical protein
MTTPQHSSPQYSLPQPLSSRPLSHEPNLFALQGEGTQITYSTSSIIGKPQLSYHQGAEPVASFIDGQIRTEETELGTLVTVTLALQPGLMRTLTLMLPAINLSSDETTFDTIGIFTTHRTTGNTGPANPPTGPLDSYSVMPFKGTAQAVIY